MEHPETDTARSAPRSKLTRSLLAGTCLTVVCGGAAQAGTIFEGTSPAPSDFPNSAPGFLLPFGTTQVMGQLGPFNEGGGDAADWFEFQGLTPGASFTLMGSNTSNSEGALAMSVFTTAAAQIGSTVHLEFNGQSNSLDWVSGLVPSDGNLVVDAFQHNLGDGPSIGSYDVTLTTNTPEPSTLVGTGLGFAALLAWRRRRRSA